uniref:Reverse transcriptase zinc-binding domain-containing protein n=1 Tax=Lactuca sativa TaxID=4236 RepID=A0A9R1VVD6_LACSA|nr:hypothetical protein LSAT_V11C400218900 [Lactuca sativa]
MMEGLNIVIKTVCSRFIFHGIKVPKNGRSIFDFFYAEDVIFVVDQSKSNLKNMGRILRCFQFISGLKFLEFVLTNLKQKDRVYLLVVWLILSHLHILRKVGNLLLSVDLIQTIGLQSKILIIRWPLDFDKKKWYLAVFSHIISHFFLLILPLLMKSKELEEVFFMGERDPMVLAPKHESILGVGSLKAQNMALLVVGGLYNLQMKTWETSTKKEKETLPRVWFNITKELISIYEIINNYNLLLEPNKLCCKPSQDGVYTVEAMRKVVDQKTTTGGDTLITWLKILSSFIWKEKRVRLPLANMLEKRGIQISSATCLLCDDREETIDHVCNRFCFVRFAFEWILKWCNILETQFSDINEVLNFAARWASYDEYGRQEMINWLEIGV